MKVYSTYVGTMAPRVFYMFLHGRCVCREIDMFFLLARISPFDEVDIVKSTWADESAVCPITEFQKMKRTSVRVTALSF